MSDLMRADCWMHMVLTYETPLSDCKKTFREFTLEQDLFIRKEIMNRIIPDAEKRGDEESSEAYRKILEVLEKEIAKKKRWSFMKIL